LELADLVKNTLKERGLALREAAKEMGISSPSLSRVQNGIGIPSIRTLVCLSQWLKVPIDQLLPASFYRERQLKFNF
jgi:transcriptional regulator with XRE-family HTH domain